MWVAHRKRANTTNHQTEISMVRQREREKDRDIAKGSQREREIERKTERDA